METMFDTLLQLPLFQGLAQEDFTRILEKVKFHFTRHKAGELLLSAGTPCRQLTFLLKGEVDIITQSPAGDYCFIEHAPAPYVLEPYSMFGMHTSYTASYRAHTEVHTVHISTAPVMDELFKYEIFRLNCMNILSNRAQTLRNRLWSHPDASPEARITHFIRCHLERPSGEKCVKIKMETLAQLINETRLTVSKALNGMQQQGLLTLHRGEITIPRAEALIR